MKKRRHIKVKIKPTITFDKFLNLLNEYAQDKYGARIVKLNDYVYIQDAVGIAAYKDTLFKQWMFQYKLGDKNEYKNAFDVLLYLQNLQLFVNMFGKTDPFEYEEE